ncbi:MAG: hypothetical protein A2583_01195 [Bdellovibrionales bacterium RIFOXYD1_FULL_53_11]|nr:MAG: hypothetical protein A2583_01195 [Bdellovibrionales bacterium RIFOXYD1_FULL_53_11]
MPGYAAPQGSKSETKAYLEQLAKAAKKAMLEASVSKYNVKKFDVSKEAKLIKRECESCEYAVLVGTGKNLKSLYSLAKESSHDGLKELVDTLWVMNKKKLLKMVVSSQWTGGLKGENVEPSHCPYYDFQVFTKDGYRFSLFIDWTD